MSVNPFQLVPAGPSGTKVPGERNSCYKQRRRDEVAPTSGWELISKVFIK